MRVAILDLGTNTFHLLIANVRGKTFKKIFKSKIVVKLGEGAIHHNWIAAKPFRRGIDALEQFKKSITEYKPQKVVAYATSAIRGAENGKKFISTAKEKTGININVISGDREAELIYFGVRQCVELDEYPVLIMDIGGGSTEFIIANDKKIFWKKSFDIGAARLLEVFNPSDPIKPDEVKLLEKFFDKELASLKAAVKKYPVTKLIGSSGSFDTFAEMAGYHFHDRNVIAKINSFKFDLNQIEILHKLILKSTLAERIHMKGLIKMRVDMIVVASICTNYILKKLKLKEMYLSKYALKEGALLVEAQNAPVGVSQKSRVKSQKSYD
jgi:exopolyphosphatase/guanosine-5'-triphosphate,3'-diphosphate pyrophosphatase